MRSALEQLDYQTSFVTSLPGDPERRNFRRQVHSAAYSLVDPTPVRAPTLLAHAPDVLAMLGLAPSATEAPDFAEILGGNRVASGMMPYAACYGGHQFGHWAGQLGDGRALTLGEVITPKGQRLELQLKGAGPTPYSRTADGRAVLRSSLREFVCSESMFHLGVPTTRALSLVATGEPVLRDMFYDGRVRAEPGAVVCRVGPTFVRFGNFELLAWNQDVETLRALADWVLQHHMPVLADAPRTPDTYAAWFHAIARATAEMIVGWMRVGFVHGVMNTDNMSILGLTIDYGPYGWLDAYDPDWTPNTTDAAHRRYRFGNQPQVAMWNLAQLAHALFPLVGEMGPLESGIAAYRVTFQQQHRAMMRAKLGLLEPLDDSADDELGRSLFKAMTATETDFTRFFRLLSEAPFEPSAEAADRARFADAFYDLDHAQRHLGLFDSWWARWRARLAAEGAGQPTVDAVRRERMARTNPVYVPRNWLAQEAIDAAERGDLEPLRKLQSVMTRPYERQPGGEHYEQKRPEWARHRAGCSMLSCSS
jgi:uncharacterized protein YdiU (UPF0061 family)